MERPGKKQGGKGPKTRPHQGGEPARPKDYQIRTVDSRYVFDNWKTHFHEGVLDAFEGADFSEAVTAKTPKDVANEIILSAFKDKDKNQGRKKEHKHLVAFKDEKVVGAFFNIPSERPHKLTKDASFGWLFTSHDLPSDHRVHVADLLVKHAHDVARRGGYERVSTVIGTRRGEEFFKKRHGYIQDPKNPRLWGRKL